MNWVSVGQLAATIGGLAGFVGLLGWLNTRRAQKLRATGEAGVEYDKFMGAAMVRMNEVNGGLRRDLTIERRIKSAVIDLFFELIKAYRRKGATSEEIDPFLDRLDDIRADR
ncbi:hypothetical protein [Mycolicibacterium fortuitum]|uniref:hypothetical protein n=1 Tax=Mycolicibacterium fortuitum TaxID=1766 RepID=UPI001AEF657C|nr:hypothetical protein [Mycolicibacterium fortuitum]MBP3086952.1 hypothetical protein [Mycolicibacterium fortuitum]